MQRGQRGTLAFIRFPEASDTLRSQHRTYCQFMPVHAPLGRIKALIHLDWTHTFKERHERLERTVRRGRILGVVAYSIFFFFLFSNSTFSLPHLPFITITILLSLLLLPLDQYDAIDPMTVCTHCCLRPWPNHFPSF